MIYVYITKDLKAFEADIRDLCLAFFSLQKIIYVHEWENDGLAELAHTRDSIGDKDNRCGRPVGDKDIIIRDFFNGSLIGDRIKVKSEIKRQLYDYLSNLTGKKMLWGTLTGIRPVTIVTNMMEGLAELARTKEGLAELARTKEGVEELARTNLKKEYYVSDIKANELIEIANREIEILHRKEIKDYKESYSFYVGVPFCKSTCLYCSFTSFNIDKYKQYVDKYLVALENELKKELHWPRFAPSDKNGHQNIYSPMTLYIGGGTPTSLSDEDFERMLSIIDKYIYKDTLIEYTVEAGRPDTITKEKLLSMKKHGVTRISINPQTFNQKTLDLIGRKHTVNDVREKFKLARSLGFDNINMDIILGLPNEHLFDVIKTLNEVRKLKPESFTVHSLALKRAARLNYELDSWTKNYYLAGLQNRRAVLEGGRIIKEGKREIDKMFYLSRILADILGLKPYYLYRQKNMAGNLENVGYAKEGKECLYNIMMMSERHTVYGFGTATTKEVIYEKNEDGTINKRVESIEGYKSVIDYCNNAI